MNSLTLRADDRECWNVFSLSQKQPKRVGLDLPESGHAYYGVFTYPAEQQFPKLTQPVLFVAPEGSLLEETKAADEVTPNSQLIVLTAYPHNVFDLGVPYLARISREFLAN